ncbi:unnamed protein product [Amoebophrya sp. A120]|nr:unnamed protein product [Amoebophrya sp. A120]|eukprot:GSA120T00014629001.1
MSGMFNSLYQTYHGAVDAIIRPPRDQYTLDELGPKRFRSGTTVWHRKDLQLFNERGHKLQCSHYLPYNLCEGIVNSAAAARATSSTGSAPGAAGADTSTASKKRQVERWPCVVYLHGNSSSRLEAMGALEVVLPLPCTLFCLDFSGSGLSDGDYVSLGYFEKEDLKIVIQYLRSTGYIGSIGLWGRSMGAVTALLHADRDHSLACLVLDSPFTRLRTLCQELVENGEYLGLKAGMLTTMIVDGVLHFLRGTVKERAGFEIDDLQPIENVSKSFVPAFFLAGADDNFISPNHSQQLYDLYAGEDKYYHVVEGADHNSPRPRDVQKKITNFLRDALQDPETRNMIRMVDWEEIVTDAAFPFLVPPQEQQGGSISSNGANVKFNQQPSKFLQQNNGGSSDGATISGAQVEMPPGFREVESRSRPGTTVYEDIETKRRYGSMQQAWRAYMLKDGVTGSPLTQQRGSSGPVGAGSVGATTTVENPLNMIAGSSGSPGANGHAGTTVPAPAAAPHQLQSGGATSSTSSAAAGPQGGTSTEPQVDHAAVVLDTLPQARPGGYRRPLAANDVNVVNKQNAETTGPETTAATRVSNQSSGLPERGIHKQDSVNTTGSVNLFPNTGISASNFQQSSSSEDDDNSGQNYQQMLDNLPSVEELSAQMAMYHAGPQELSSSWSVVELKELGFPEQSCEEAKANGLSFEEAVEYCVSRSSVVANGGGAGGAEGEFDLGEVERGSGRDSVT